MRTGAALQSSFPRRERAIAKKRANLETRRIRADRQGNAPGGGYATNLGTTPHVLTALAATPGA